MFEGLNTEEALKKKHAVSVFMGKELRHEDVKMKKVKREKEDEML